MKILGINHDMYISSAALIIDGKVVAACAEERLIRDKMTRVFPSIISAAEVIYISWLMPNIFII